MDVPKIKPPLSSPTYEKINLERLKQSQETTDAAKRAVGKSVQLVDQSKELIRQLHKTKRKAG